MRSISFPTSLGVCLSGQTVGVTPKPYIEYNPQDPGSLAAAIKASQAQVFGAQQQCGNSAPGYDAPKPREIPDRVARLFELTEGLSERIARLGGRLESVLIPEPEGDSENQKSCSAPSATALGDQLAQLATRLTLMINAVYRLDAQLEL